jgi:hypothetical protein
MGNKQVSRERPGMDRHSDILPYYALSATGRSGLVCTESGSQRQVGIRASEGVGLTKEPPCVVNYSATHRKPESVHKSPKPSREPGRRGRHTRQRGQVPWDHKGERYSFRKELYHTPSTRGRSGLVNNRAVARDKRWRTRQRS